MLLRPGTVPVPVPVLSLVNRCYVSCSYDVQQAKKVSMEVVKRPRGRPPLPETLRRRLKEQQHHHQQQQQRSRSAVESVKSSPSAATNTNESRTSHSTVNSGQNASPRQSPEPPPVVVKKRRKQGPRGMARLFVNRPGSKINTSAKPSLKSPSSTDEFSPQKHQVLDSLPESTDVGKLAEAAERREQRTEVATELVMPSLSSPIWHPASKRVLDAVCVTDVTACSGVTVTVRESSVVDGFFRSRPDEP